MSKVQQRRKAIRDFERDKNRKSWKKSREEKRRIRKARRAQRKNLEKGLKDVNEPAVKKRRPTRLDKLKERIEKERNVKN